MTIKDGIKQPWESHIDSLRHEEQWKEVMTIRSGPARILSAGSTRCCSTSSGTETQNAYISSSETPRRKNAPTAVSTYQLVRHLNQITRRNGTKKQGIRGARKCRSKRNLGILQALNDDTTNAPTFFLKRRGVSTKTSGRFKNTSGGCPQNALLTPSKPNFRRKTFVRLNICRTFTFRILHHKNK